MAEWGHPRRTMDFSHKLIKLPTVSIYPQPAVGVGPICFHLDVSSDWLKITTQTSGTFAPKGFSSAC
ncbi:MAG: hypothetical protein NT128_04805 [Proteobacteria bacterium]|nr:hypothetical protein [Pseudomonadota bacterium]